MNTPQLEVADPYDCLVPTSRVIAGSGDGPLEGMSFVAKDLFDIEGHTPSFGHSTWRDTHLPATRMAPAVRALLDAGATLTGLTKMDQLAYSLIGDVGEGTPPLNANDPDLYCGGSSSGSASAVAGGLADFALGTDTAGSVRVPAAACGVLSLRPTHDLISSRGVTPLAPSLDAVGVLASSAASLAAAMNVLVPDLADQRSSNDVNILLADDLFAMVDDETSTVAREFAERLAELLDSPLKAIKFQTFTDPEVGNLFARLQSREIWANHADWVTEHGADLAADVRTRLERCKDLSSDSAAVQESDIAERRNYCDRFDIAVPEGAIVLLPTLPEHGPKKSWTPEKLIEFRTGCFRLTAPSSLRGAPQAVWSIRSSTGRSIGLSMLAAPGQDRLLLDVMGQLAET